MAKSPESSSFGGELLSLRNYKRNQGRLTRQLTAAAVALMLFFGCYTLSQGWLAGYVSTYVTTRVSYPATEPDPTLDAALVDLAEQTGGTLVEEDVTRRSGRELIFSYPASRYWSTDPDLQTAALNRIAAFHEAVQENHPDRVNVATGTDTRRIPATWISFGVPLLLFLIGLWITWRIINYPKFADFLISVEAEMDKVSWPSRQELFRATVVVVTTMVFLGAVLFLYDLFWVWLFQSIGILQDV